MTRKKPTKAQLELSSLTRRVARRVKKERAPRAQGVKLTRVQHRPRADHKARHPVHVTLRGAKGIPSFRSQSLQTLFTRAVARQARRDYGGCFRVCQFSIQHTHLHLIVEAEPVTQEMLAEAKERDGRELLSKRAKKGLETLDRDMLRRGIAGFMISLAKQLNNLLGRAGAVWGDRHHRRALESPRAVRNALVYVLQNHRRHGLGLEIKTLDPYSSAPWFRGWKDSSEALDATSGRWVPPARTWLLREGWQKTDGLLSIHDYPRAD